jgi:hypothetical protein
MYDSILSRRSVRGTKVEEVYLVAESRHFLWNRHVAE